LGATALTGITFSTTNAFSDVGINSKETTTIFIENLTVALINHRPSTMLHNKIVHPEASIDDFAIKF
jgi:hypothetical protein